MVRLVREDPIRTVILVEIAVTVALYGWGLFRTGRMLLARWDHLGRTSRQISVGRFLRSTAMVLFMVTMALAYIGLWGKPLTIRLPLGQVGLLLALIGWGLVDRQHWEGM